MIKDPKECQHEQFSSQVAIGRMLDTGKFIADVLITCAECGLPFRFIGVPAGVAWDHPACSIDSVELHAPIEPEYTKELQSGATFQMPEIPRRH